MGDEINLYKRFMEGLLEKRIDLYAKLIKSGRAWPKVEIYAKFNELLHSLSDEKRIILADLIQNTRDSAIFDTLEYFDDSINLEKLQVSQNGVKFPCDFFGGDFHNDWVALCQGDMWGNEIC